MSRKKRCYQATTLNCGYKSVKINDMNLVRRFDRLCKINNTTWESMTIKAIKEYLTNHENDDLKEMNRAELEEIIKQYRNGNQYTTF